MRDHWRPRHTGACYLPSLALSGALSAAPAGPGLQLELPRALLPCSDLDREVSVKVRVGSSVDEVGLCQS